MDPSIPDSTAFYIQEIGALLFGMVFLFLYRQSKAVYFGLWTIAWVLRFLAAIFGYELLRTSHTGWLAPYATFEFAFVIVLISAARAGFASSDVKDWRTVLRLSPRIAPVKVAVFPLLKNRPELVAFAGELYRKLKRKYAVFYDESGAIGRRYRRQDEIGTPWCVTIDFETIEKDGTFTLRERDSMQQKRIGEAELLALLEERVY